MKCPNCDQEFRLTASEYVREPMGRHNCPACGARFKLKTSVSYISILVLAVLILAVAPGLVALYFFHSWLSYGVTCTVCTVLFVLPLDFWLDDRWRKSSKL